MPELEKNVAQASHKLHAGAALAASAVDEVCRRSFTPLVFMAGEVGCGKTTLIASLHDAFLAGPLGIYRFARSETLVAFEERCFESRAKSEGLEPQTPRTRYESGQEYFHLILQRQDNGSSHDILFADMSGEFYERSLYSNAEMRHLKDLRRAQVLLLLLDGTALINPNTRQRVRSDALSFVRRCKEQALLSDTTFLQICISKWDTVVSAGGSASEETLAFINSRINTAALARQVSVLPISARPAPGSDELKLSGVRDLFPSWISQLPHQLTLHAGVRRESLADLRPYGHFVGQRVSR